MVGLVARLFLKKPPDRAAEAVLSPLGEHAVISAEPKTRADVRAYENTLLFISVCIVCVKRVSASVFVCVRQDNPNYNKYK